MFDVGRPVRTDPAGGWHHVVNRGVDRCVVFRDDRDRVEFGRLLGLACERSGVFVHSYCLMTNHFHLVLECPDGGLSDVMQHLGGRYVRHFNDRHGRDGPLFRGRFFARPIEHDADLIGVFRYVHRNPLAFLAPTQLERYRWSSLRTYLGARAPLPWMRTDVVNSLVGGPDRVRELVLDSSVSPDARLVDAGWQHFVALAVDECLDELPSQRVDRTVLVRLADRVDATTQQRLVELLAFPTERAAREARRRAHRRADEHPSIDRAVDAVLRMVA